MNCELVTTLSLTWKWENNAKKLKKYKKREPSGPQFSNQSTLNNLLFLSYVSQ